jgi:endonuclease YncB( thermonuclease family)
MTMSPLGAGNLEGIDAPETGRGKNTPGRPFGNRARQALSDKIAGNTVRVEWKKEDQYGRILGHVYLGDRWLNCEMVRDGMAWHFKRYIRNQDLSNNEEWARAAKRGLWADPDPVPPWEYRAGKAANARAKRKR